VAQYLEVVAVLTVSGGAPSENDGPGAAQYLDITIACT
jgi:hypothetical protein